MGVEGIAIGNVLASANVASDHPDFLGPNECQTKGLCQLLVEVICVILLFAGQRFVGFLMMHGLPHWCMFCLLLSFYDDH